MLRMDRTMFKMNKIMFKINQIIFKIDRNMLKMDRIMFKMNWIMFKINWIMFKMFKVERIMLKVERIMFDGERIMFKVDRIMTKKKKFIYYSVYAWGFPFLISMITLTIESIPTWLTENLITPGDNKQRKISWPFLLEIQSIHILKNIKKYDSNFEKLRVFYNRKTYKGTVYKIYQL